MGQTCVLEAGSCSVIEAAYVEALRHRWIESQHHGRDLGELAFYDWYARYWWTFLRYRHLEHLLGECRWNEFGGRSFGSLSGTQLSDLAAEIVDLYRQGFENLDIINWALRLQHDMDSVIHWLVRINMNDARIAPRHDR